MGAKSKLKDALRKLEDAVREIKRLPTTNQAQIQRIIRDIEDAQRDIDGAISNIRNDHL